MARLKDSLNKRDKYKVIQDVVDDTGNDVKDIRVYPSTRAIIEDFPQFSSYSIYDYCRGRVGLKHKKSIERFKGFHFEKV